MLSHPTQSVTPSEEARQTVDTNHLRPNNGGTFFGPNLPVSINNNNNNAGTTDQAAGASNNIDVINNSNLSQINSLINSPLTEEEEEVLAEYDCRLYGLLKLESVEQIFKRYFLIKAILCYEKRVKALIDEDFSDFIETKNSGINSSSNKSTENVDSEVVAPADSVKLKKEEEDLCVLERKRSKYTQVAKLYLSLGHFYLLIYDYSKALECYQKFFNFKLHKLQVSKLVIFF